MWFGLVWCGPPVMDQRPALGNVLYSSTFILRTVTSHQEKLFQRKIVKKNSLHFNMALIINKYCFKKELHVHVCAPV